MLQLDNGCRRVIALPTSLVGRLADPLRANTVFYQDIAVGSIVSRLEPSSAPAPTTITSSVAPPSTSAPVASSSSGTTTPAPRSEAGESSKLYIMTLGVLSPYRRQGLATKLVQHVIAEAEASHLPPAAVEPKPAAATKEETPASKKAKPEEKVAEKVAEVVKPRARVESLYLHVQVSNDEARAFWEKHGFQVTVRVRVRRLFVSSPLTFIALPRLFDLLHSFLSHSRTLALSHSNAIASNCPRTITGHNHQLLPQD